MALGFGIKVKKSAHKGSLCIISIFVWTNIMYQIYITISIESNLYLSACLLREFHPNEASSADQYTNLL